MVGKKHAGNSQYIPIYYLGNCDVDGYKFEAPPLDKGAGITLLNEPLHDVHRSAQAIVGTGGAILTYALECVRGSTTQFQILKHVSRVSWRASPAYDLMDILNFTEAKRNLKVFELIKRYGIDEGHRVFSADVVNKASCLRSFVEGPGREMRLSVDFVHVNGRRWRRARTLFDFCCLEVEEIIAHQREVIRCVWCGHPYVPERVKADNRFCHPSCRTKADADRREKEAHDQN